MGAVFSLFKLRWRRSPQYAPLPPNITRTFISTPSGDLELLFASSEHDCPTDHQRVRTRPPVLFVHGGFGHAAVWAPWMSYLRGSYDGNVYAISLRGHGASWAPGFIEMWAWTGLRELAGDLVAAVRDVERREQGRECVLVGHSGGGGLIQYVLAQGMCRAVGMGLVAAFPNFGSFGVYWNWAKMDPWFLGRSLVHFQHPRSPLSETRLVERAFFCHEMSRERVVEFERWMAEYESLRWPIEMMKDWINVQSVVGSITGWDGGMGSPRVMVMAGSEDKLMGVRLMEYMAGDYRRGVQTLVEEKRHDAVAMQSRGTMELTKGVEENCEAGVSMVVVKGAGHHVQNDVQAEQAAEVFRMFMEGL